MCLKKPLQKFIYLVLFVHLNESYILQVYFAETARAISGIPIFNFSFFKDSIYLISSDKISQIFGPV